MQGTTLNQSEYLICEQCDCLHQRLALPPGARAHCQRCDAPLESGVPTSYALSLALASSGLVMLLIAHLNPVLGIVLQGQKQSATLWAASVTLMQEGAWFLSPLVLATTLVFPLLELLSLCAVLLMAQLGLSLRPVAWVLRLLQWVRPWVMVEVLMLGVLISIVKLSADADILPGVGLWAFAAVMLLLAAASASLEAKSLWQRV